MNKNKKEKFKKLLLEEKKKILKSLGINIESLKKEDGGNKEESLYNIHMADIATLMREQEKKAINATKELKILKLIDEALEKIYNDAYGVCEKCGEKIEEERLAFIPYCKLCIVCQREEDLE